MTEYSEKNPLAELAEELDFNHFPHTCSKRQDAALLKAQRIVAELAKAQVADGMARRVTARANCLEYSFGNEPLKTVGIFMTEHFPKWICSALNVVEKCRAIADKID